MPVGPYKTFGECTAAQRKKGKSEESADKICGEMEKRTQKATESLILCDNGLKYVRQQLESLESQTGIDTNTLFDPSISEEDKNKYVMFNPSDVQKEDRYFGKSFLFSPAINLNDWGVTLDSLPKNIYSFKDMPVVLTEDFGHPDNGLKYDTLENTLNYQEGFRVGHILDVVQKDGIYYAIWEITDQKARKMFQENKMPLFVSPAIAHNENTTRKSNWRGLHLAIVKSPAFTTQKAIINGTCAGSQELCMIQLATASIKGLDVQKEEQSTNPTQQEFDKDFVLDHYKSNIEKLVNHNIINFNTQKAKKEIIKMENNTSSTNNQQNDVSTKTPSPVVQDKYFDLNMCVANFVERGLDPNTAREICVTAGASDQGMSGGQGQQPQADPARGANPAAGYSFTKDEFALKLGNVLQNKNHLITQLQNKLTTYETQFKEKTGFDPNEDAFKTIKRLYQEDEQKKIDAKANEYVELIKLYESNEQEVKDLAKIYLDANLPIESVKNIYKNKKTLEELNKVNNPNQQTQTAANAEKPHEMFNNMKENNGYANKTETQDNRMIQTSTASTNSGNNNVSGTSNILLDIFKPRFNENSSNNVKEGEL